VSGRDDLTVGDDISINNSTFDNSAVAAGRGANAQHGGSTGSDARFWAELDTLRRDLTNLLVRLVAQPSTEHTDDAVSQIYAVQGQLATGRRDRRGVLRNLDQLLASLSAAVTVGPYVVPAEEIAPVQEFVARHGE
jgi:hypothetical protein